MVHRGTSICRVAGCRSRRPGLRAGGQPGPRRRPGGGGGRHRDHGRSRTGRRLLPPRLQEEPSRRGRGRPPATGLAPGRPRRPLVVGRQRHLGRLRARGPPGRAVPVPGRRRLPRVRSPGPGRRRPARTVLRPRGHRQAGDGHHPDHGRARRRGLDPRARAGCGHDQRGPRRRALARLSDRRPAHAGRHPVGDHHHPTGRSCPRRTARRTRPVRLRRRLLRVHDRHRPVLQRWDHRVGVVLRVPAHRPGGSTGAADRARRRPRRRPHPLAHRAGHPLPRRLRRRAGRRRTGHRWRSVQQHHRPHPRGVRAQCPPPRRRQPSDGRPDRRPRGAALGPADRAPTLRPGHRRGPRPLRRAGSGRAGPASGTAPPRPSSVGAGTTWSAD